MKWQRPVIAERHRPAYCRCRTCNPIGWFGGEDRSQMVVCEVCGNKRCPHATDHRNACTGSNEPGQLGSAYA